MERRLGELGGCAQRDPGPIAIPTVSDPDHLNHQLVVEDLVDDSVVAYPDSVGANLSDQLGRCRRTRLASQQIDGSANSLLFPPR
jgi:hypothetical protein